ncbi:MAG: putative manganese transporter [Candidatus Gastranaerophilales bacterium]|nr:putative manganese transporter [Candidatus Gastranaerophilales bacterium]
MFTEFVKLATYIPDYALDAINDSFSILPSLFIIFVIIELSENYFCKKLTKLPKYSTALGPLIGGCLAMVPQCGFSVIASSLYIGRLISKGTLLAVYLSTSDEALPTLLACPNSYKVVAPLLAIKVVIGVAAGYLIDIIWKPKNINCENDAEEIEEQDGCCSSKVFTKKNIFIHPLKHTFHIFVFILLTLLVLNFAIFKYGSHLNDLLLNNSLWQPVIASIIGLIPSCAISVLITMLYIKGAISFGATIAGLASGAGLGLLVLIRKNDKLSDTLFIITLLFAISAIAGVLIQLLNISIVI